MVNPTLETLRYEGFLVEILWYLLSHNICAGNCKDCILRYRPGRQMKTAWETEWYDCPRDLLNRLWKDFLTAERELREVGKENGNG